MGGGLSSNTSRCVDVFIGGHVRKKHTDTTSESEHMQEGAAHCVDWRTGRDLSSTQLLSIGASLGYCEVRVLRHTSEMNGQY